MKSRDPVEVQLERLEADGCAYSADDRYAVYGALPGETVTAVPVARKRKRLYMRTVAVSDPSPERVVPGCSAAAYCGGCSYQHASREAQLGLKSALLAGLLAPLEPEIWLPPITGSAWHYRSKARLGVKFVDKKDRVLVGFREKQKPYIAEIERCPVLVEPVASMIDSLAGLIAGLSVPRAIPQVEIASGDSDSTATALIFRHLEPLSTDDLAALREFGETEGVQILLQPGAPTSTHRIFPVPSTAEPAGTEEILSYDLPDFDLTFRFTPHDFTQVNLEINRLMVQRAIDMLAPGPDDRVLDAFCGIGNFSLAIARYAGHVTGLEYAADSIARARMNAGLNGIENVTFEVADLHNLSGESPQNRGFSGFDKILLDPPRSGAEELVKTLASHDVERVVYVSCNPETLSRDAKILVEQGFKLRSAGIIDMFPHTTHVESIALFVRT